MADYDIFREQLAIKFPAFGHALWDPSPPEPNRPVKVGDVGFICKGKFHRLFNVLHPKAEQSNVPTDHEPLISESSNHITQDTLSCGNYSSVGVGVQNKLDAYSSGPDDVERVLFKHSRRKGAVLSLPVKARREDTLAQSLFGELMVKRADHWFAFARQLDLGIEKMEEIILVTGCDRTVSWTKVTFFGDQDDAQASFGVKRFHGDDPGNNIQFSREPVEGAVLNHGPEGTHLPENQTIFIRGFRVTRTSKTPTPLISAIQTHRDPLHVLLDYISEQAPDCDMALIHDDDLERIYGIGEDSSLEALQPDMVMDLLRRSNIETHKVCYGSPDADTGVVWVAMLSTLSENWSSMLHPQQLNTVAPWQNPGLGPRRVNEPPARSPSADCPSVPHVPGDINLCDSTPLGRLEGANGLPTLDEIGRSPSVIWSSLSNLAHAERHQLVPTMVVVYCTVSFFGWVFPLTWLDMSKHWSPFLFASSLLFVWSEREHTHRRLDEMHETIKAIQRHITSSPSNPATPALVAEASDILHITAKTSLANQERLSNHQEAEEVLVKNGAEGHQKAKEDMLGPVSAPEHSPPPAARPSFKFRRQLEGSPATFGSTDDAPTPISSPLVFAPAAKPAEGILFFGSVAIQNGGSDSVSPAVTHRPLPLAHPSTSPSQVAPAVTSKPSPSPKIDKKSIPKPFSGPPTQSVSTTQSHAILPIYRPPQPSASQPHPPVISPSSSPPPAKQSTSLSANAGTFIPVKKVSITNASGQEVTLDTLKQPAQPTPTPVPPPLPPSPTSAKKDSDWKPIRIESQEQKERRLTEERTKEGESEDKTESSDALTRANEAAARREIEEQERHEAEERKAREEAERAEMERKEAEERAVLEKERMEAEERAVLEKERREAEERTVLEKERKEVEERAVLEKERREVEERAVLEKECREAEESAALEKERREAEERAASEAHEQEEQEKERMRLEEEARVQREADEQAEKERVGREQACKLQEEEARAKEEAERQLKAEEDIAKAVEASENTHSLPDDVEEFPSSLPSLPEEGGFGVDVSEPATAATEELASPNKSTVDLQPPPSTSPAPHIPAELPVEKESLRIDSSLPPSPEQPEKRPGPLDFQTTTDTDIAPHLPSALATARPIEDINHITYPQGIDRPKLELSVNTQEGKFRYDRAFLLQFMDICKEKPDNLPPLDAIGLKLTDKSRTMAQGRSGRNRSSNSPSVPPNTQPASLSPDFISAPTDKSAGSGFQMGQFSTPAGMMSREERFPAASTGRSVSGTGGSPEGRPAMVVRTVGQSGTGRERTRSKRGATDPTSHPSVAGNAGPATPVSVMGPPTVPVTPLEMSANRWVATSMCHNGADVDPDSPDMVNRKVTALLNKLTMKRFELISDQIIAWANKSKRENDGRTLARVIKLVFEMATDGTMFSEMYARLCRKMMEQISPKVQDDGIKNAEGKSFAGGQLFRKYLLNRCQEDFERGWVDEETTAAAAATKATEDRAIKEANEKTKGGEESRLYSDEYYAAAKAKRRGLGLIRFLGELFKLQMLTERIMHECIKKLLGNMETPEKEDIESLCELLTTVGSLLDTQKAQAYLDVYFLRMQELMENKIVNAHMVSMLHGVMELRERGWVLRGTVASPTTIARVHEVVANERRAQMKGSDNEVTGEAVSPQVAPPTLSLAEAQAKIEEDTKEFFSIRMLDEAESYFSSLSIRRRHLLVDALVTKSIEMKEPDVVLVSELFVRVREKGLCVPRIFERGFNELAKALDDLTIDIPKAWTYFAILLKGSGLDQDKERRGRIAEKTMDPDKLNRLLECELLASSVPFVLCH